MRTEKMRQDNIRKVFSASAELFANNGVLNTNLEMIAETAGVSLRSVVNYFGTRDKLMVEMRKYLVERGTNDIRKQCGSEEFLALSGLDKILSLIKTMVAYTKEKYLYICALIEMRSMDKGPKKQDDEIIPPVLEVHDLFIKFVKEGVEDGSIKKDVDAERNVPFLVVTIKGLLSQYATVIKDRDRKSFDTFNESFKGLDCLLKTLLSAN